MNNKEIDELCQLLNLSKEEVIASLNMEIDLKKKKEEKDFEFAKSLQSKFSNEENKKEVKIVNKGRKSLCGWYEIFDEKTQKFYYYEPNLHLNTWLHPKEQGIYPDDEFVFISTKNNIIYENNLVDLSPLDNDPPKNEEIFDEDLEFVIELSKKEQKMDKTEIELEMIKNYELKEKESLKKENELKDSELAKELSLIEEGFSCPICLEDNIKSDEVFIFTTCKHKQCRDCTRNHFESLIKSSTFPLNCPYCKSEATDEDVELVVPLELFNKYDEFRLKFLMESDKNYVNCPHPGCKNGVIVEDPRLFNPWKCTSCKNSFCLKCKETSHNGSCEDYKKWKIENGQVEDKLNDLIKKGNLKICPSCGFGVEKDGGCESVLCTKCKIGFCWHCGIKNIDCKCKNNPHHQGKNW